MIIPAKTNKPYILPPKVAIYGGIFLYCRYLIINCLGNAINHQLNK